MAVITIQTFTIPDWHYGGSTATLKLTSSNDWTDLAGQAHSQGSPGSQNGFSQDIPCTVSGTDVIVPQFQTTSTTDSRQPLTLITGVLFDEKRTPRWHLFDDFVIPTTTPLSWTALQDLNRRSRALPSPASVYLDRTGVLTLVEELMQGLFHESFTGTGVQTVYTLARTPVLDSEVVFVNGIKNSNAVSGDNTYQISGSTITFNLAPQNQDRIEVYYRINSGLVGGGQIPNQIQESSGPTVLTLGSIGRHQYLKRSSGSVIVGAGALPVFDVMAYGAVAGGAINNKTAFQAAIDAMPQSGGELYIPEGTFYLGASAQGLIMRIIKQNIKIHGVGMGATTLLYNSAGRTGPVGSGALVYAGDVAINHIADGFKISDLTISDQNTANYSGFGPGGIWIYLSDNVWVERVECIDCKGQAITVNGTVSGGEPANSNVTVRDCIVRGSLAGGWVDGDAVNIGNYGSIRLLNNRLSGFTSNGYEGGGQSTDTYLTGNIIDCSASATGKGMGTIAGKRIQIIGNTVLEWNDGGTGIGMAQDANTYAIQDVVIANNILRSSVAGISVTGIRFQPVIGTAASLLGPLFIHDNDIKAYGQAIELRTATSAKIHDNSFDRNQSHAAAINGSAGSNPAINAADMIEIYQNRVFNYQSSDPYGMLINFWDANWKVPRLRLWGNKIGQVISDSGNGAIDGHNGATFNPGTITAAGMSSATQTLSLTGALVGDTVQFSTDTALPVGCSVIAQVTATDTITWRVVNLSGADQTIGSTVFRFWIVRR